MSEEHHGGDIELARCAEQAIRVGAEWLVERLYVDAGERLGVAGDLSAARPA